MVTGITNLSGLRAIKTMQTSKKRSIPRVQSPSAYLDLYMLDKEKGRLEKEVCGLEKRKKSIQKRLDEVNTEIDILRKADSTTQKVNPDPSKKTSGEEWKTLTLKY